MLYTCNPRRMRVRARGGGNWGELPPQTPLRAYAASYKEISISLGNHDLGLQMSCVWVFSPTETFPRPPEIIRKKLYKFVNFEIF